MFIFCSRCKRQAELPPAAARHTLCVVGRRRSGYWRDVSVRYKQTVIGIAWALIRPFLMMVVFTVIFGKLANLPSDGTVPYALMVFAGMLPWSFFSSALSDASNSLLNNEHLISKVYFPRLIVPTAAVGVHPLGSTDVTPFKWRPAGRVPLQT
jgi:ABC-2 type transporter